MLDILSPLTFEFGLGGVGGFIAGYALKKVSKLVALMLGFFVILLLYLGVSGIITIHFSELWDSVAGFLGLAGQSVGWITTILSLLPFMGSFLVGFLIGFKLG